MTVRGWYQGVEESNINGLRRLVGGFIPNNTSSPVVKYGSGFTVAYSAVGIWLLTLDESWSHFLGGPLTWQVESALAHDGALSWGAVSKSAKTIQIVNRVAGTKTDVAASGALRAVWFEMLVARNAVPGINGLTT